MDDFQKLDANTQQKIQFRLTELLRARGISEYFGVRITSAGELLIQPKSATVLSNDAQENLNVLLQSLSLTNVLEYKKVNIRHAQTSVEGYHVKSVDSSKLDAFAARKLVDNPDKISSNIWSRISPEIREYWGDFSDDLKQHIIACTEKHLSNRLQQLSSEVDMGDDLQDAITTEIPSIPVYLPNSSLESGHSNELYDLSSILKLGKGEDPYTKNKFQLNQIIPAKDKLSLIEQKLIDNGIKIPSQEQVKTSAATQEVLPPTADAVISLFQEIFKKFNVVNNYRILSCKQDSIMVRESSQNQPNRAIKDFMKKFFEKLQENKLLDYKSRSLVCSNRKDSIDICLFQFSNIKNIQAIRENLNKIAVNRLDDDFCQVKDSISTIMKKRLQDNVDFSSIVIEEVFCGKLNTCNSFADLKNICKSISADDKKRLNHYYVEIIDAVNRSGDALELQQSLTSMYPTTPNNRPGCY